MPLRFPLMACLMLLPLEAAQDPSASAMEFVDKLRSGKISLEPRGDTAISAGTSPAKRNIIESGLERMVDTLRNARLEPGPIRQEGDLAGLILREGGVEDPSRIRILALAMVREEGDWKVAPIPASFENTSVAHSSVLSRKAKAIEHWLAREQVGERERLRQSAEARLRGLYEKALPEDQLRKMTAEQVMTAYLHACETNDQDRIFCLSGGLAGSLPEYWPALNEGIRLAMARPDTSEHPWRQLFSKKVLRQAVLASGLRKESMAEPASDHDEVRVVCLDMAHDLEERWSCVSLPLTRQPNGLWQMGYPVKCDAEQTDLSAFTRRWMAGTQAAHQATADGLKSAIREAMTSRPAAQWRSLLAYPVGSTERQRTCIEQVAGIWAEGNQPGNPKVLLESAWFEEEGHACAVMQWFAIGGGDSIPPVFLHLEKSEAGWLWNPLPDAKSVEKAEAWAKPLITDQRDLAIESLLDPCLRFTENAGSPGEENARRAVQEFLDDLAQMRWQGALGHCALLDTPQSQDLLLRNFGHESQSAAAQRLSGRTLTAVSGKHIALVGDLVIENGQSTIRSILPVVNIKSSGPRILMEIDLGDPDKPGRSLLNRRSIAHLKTVHQDAAGELPSLLDFLMKLSVSTEKPVKKD